jgi:hypothetical protein
MLVMMAGNATGDADMAALTAARATPMFRSILKSFGVVSLMLFLPLM